MFARAAGPAAAASSYQPPPPYPVASGGEVQGSSAGGFGAGRPGSAPLSQEQIRASLVTAAEEKVKKVLREEFNTKQVS